MRFITSTYVERDRLLFTTELYNTDNAYDLNTGVFTAPVAGLYHFNLLMYNLFSEPQWIGIAEVDSMHVKAEGGNESFADGWGRNTNQVNANLNLKKGDKIAAVYLGEKAAKLLMQKIG